MDVSQLRIASQNIGLVSVDAQELKKMADELAAQKAKGFEIAGENSQLKAKIEEYELAIVRGIEQLQLAMRELYLKMHESHELLRAAKEFGTSPEISKAIEVLLARDGLYETDTGGA